MDVLEKIKETVLEHIVLAIFGLIVLLLLIILRAFLFSVWDKVAGATPPQALWALLALAGIAIVILAALLIDARRSLKHTSAELRKAQNAPPPPPPPAPPPKPGYFKFYGLFWDNDLNPFCPADETLLFVYTQDDKANGGKYDRLRCPRCRMSFPLRDEKYGLVTLPYAQQQIRIALDNA